MGFIYKLLGQERDQKIGWSLRGEPTGSPEPMEQIETDKEK